MEKKSVGASLKVPKLGLNNQSKKVQISKITCEKEPKNSKKTVYQQEISLAWKSVNQTNQFDKMLKMTSSHVRKT